MDKPYGMKRLGYWRVERDDFIIDVKDEELLKQEKCIYAFTKDDEFIRIGSSKKVLRTRIQAWRRDVSKALKGKKSQTPAWEAEGWRQYRSGDLWARVGSVVKSPVGEFETYLDEESILIGRYLPPLNRSKHR